MKIILFPFARNISPDKPHPKSPELKWWKRLVTLLENLRHTIIQVGVTGETSLVKDVRFNLSVVDLSALIQSADTFISIDSMGQHLCWDLNKRGIVIWGQSDPNIFGHPEHINLLKDKKYLRDKQYWLWTQTTFQPDAFVEPEEVVAALSEISDKYNISEIMHGSNAS